VDAEVRGVLVGRDMVLDEFEAEECDGCADGDEQDDGECDSAQDFHGVQMLLVCLPANDTASS